MTAALTYLELTNLAIKDSKVTVGQLTSSTFPTTTDPLQIDFKRWVNDAHRELQMERRQWEFKNKLANLLIGPRVYVEENISGTNSPAPGNRLVGDDTGVDLTIAAVSLLSGAWVSGNATAFITYTTRDGQFKFNELCDLKQSNGTLIEADHLRIKGWGRYNLATEISDLAEPVMNSFSIQSTGGSSVQTNTSAFDPSPLVFVPWDVWVTLYENQDGAAYGQPCYFTVTPDGLYDFYPRPDQYYLLRFYYQKAVQDLTLYTDTPTDLPADYHRAIVWRAVMYYADSDSKSAIYLKARKQYEFYKKRMEENLMPTPGWGRNPFNA